MFEPHLKKINLIWTFPNLNPAVILHAPPEKKKSAYDAAQISAGKFQAIWNCTLKTYIDHGL